MKYIYIYIVQIKYVELFLKSTHFMLTMGFGVFVLFFWKMI